MLWDKAQAQINNKMYKQSVEEYEKRQRKLDNQRVRNQKNGTQPNLPKDGVASMTVGGEPVLLADNDGNVLFNKMKKIDENFDEIQYIVYFFRYKCKCKTYLGILICCNFINQMKISKTKDQKVSFDEDGEIEPDVDINTEEGFKELENEIISNRADAILSANLQQNELGAKKNCEHDQSDISSQCNLFDYNTLDLVKILILC